MAGRYAFPTWGPYCATKFAIEALSDALHMEVAPFGIRVVVIEPGAMMNRHAPGPEVVARVIQKAIEAPRLRARYQVPASAWWMVKLAPLFGGSAMDWPIGRMTR